ncbi:MAG: putative toxin-antitoxin system toxin component, PIN family [Muribaculaceae bacterium]|nr:putative toxin-antitoxin system toxin component, PIN family [Muribaculaceae bacterium]
MNEEKKVYAVIDTNVLVSSLYSKNGTSNPYRVINSVLNGIITPLYNDEIINEYRDVLSRNKFKFNTDDIENLIGAFIAFGMDTDRTNVNEYFPDKDDTVFFEVAMSVETAYLVIGNIKHFPRKPFVVTPSQMIEILRANRLIE